MRERRHAVVPHDHVSKSEPVVAPYRAPRWLARRPRADDLAVPAARARASRYRRERVDTPDGDFWDFDWLDAAGGAGRAARRAVPRPRRRLAIRTTRAR